MSNITEVLLLKILTERSNYSRYSRFIKKHVLSDWGGVLFKDFGEYFSDNDSIQEIDIDKFKLFFRVKHPVIKPEKLEIYETALDNIRDTDLDEYEIETEAVTKAFITRDYSSQIAEKAMQIAEGEDDVEIEDIKSLLNEYEESVGQVDITDKLEVKTDIVTLIQQQSVQEGLEWRLEELNQSIGPVSHQLIIFGARPNSGKTLFITSELSYMAQQLKGTDKYAIFLNNEEAGGVVKHKVVQSALGRTDQELADDPVQALADLEDLWGVSNRVKVFDDVFDLWTANHVLERNNPGVIVVDQLWNMQGMSKRVDNEVTRITLLYKEARKWGKMYKCPVLVVHQLDGSAGGVMYPNMEQFYLSKTALQGDGDGIITLGKSYDETVPEYSRGLHIVKNKMGKGKRCVPAFKHGKFEIDIAPEVGRFKGKL